MTAPISVLAAGKMLGVSHTAVQKAISSGRLVDCVVYVRGMPKILPDKIAEEWVRNTDAVMSLAKGVNLSLRMGVNQPPRVPHAQKPARTKALRPVESDVPPRRTARDDDGMESPARSGPDMNASRAVKSLYEARMAKIEFEEKAGTLVKADAVKVEAFKKARQVRDALLTMPERISGQLAAETDPHKCHQMLTAEITAALMELSESKA